MNDVGGSDSGPKGLRAGKTSRTSDANFEDDSEWDVGIGNLIIDLDADIADAERRTNNNETTRGVTNTSATSNSTIATAAASNSNSPIHAISPSITPPITSQMHIPTTSGSSGNTSSSASSNNSTNSITTNSTTSNVSSTKGKLTPAPFSTKNNNPTGGGTAAATSVELSGNNSMEHSAVVDPKGLKMKIKRTKTGTKSGADEKHEIVKTDLNTSASSLLSSTVSGSSNSSSTGSINNNNAGGIVANSKTSIGASSLNESISSKGHSSSSHKDKDKIKDGIMIDVDSVVGGGGGGISNHSSGSGVSGTSINNGLNKDAAIINKDSSTVSGTGNGEQGKNKTPRKGKEPHNKKVKNGNNNNNNNGTSNKKNEQRNSNSTSSSDTAKNNSISHTIKDGKDYFTATVSLNVPTIVPNVSSAFSKTTLKVPNSTSSSNTQNSIHSPSPASADPTRNHNHSLIPNNTSPWVAGSPNKGMEKTLSSSQTLSVENKGNNGIQSIGRKVKAILDGNLDKQIHREDGVSTSTGLSAIASSYRNSAENPSSISATVNHTGPPPGSSPKSKNFQSGPSQDVCIGTSVGTVTDPEFLGPCEPGMDIQLSGIVWHENENGILVVNVTWRGKTYVGTLIDCTKNDWAPPRFCDSPTSDLEMRTPKNRAKRGRGQAATPVNELLPDVRVANVKLRNGAKGRRGSATSNAFVAPASPLKGCSVDQWPKRKTRGSENESQDEPTPSGGGGGGGKTTKRLKVSINKEERNKDRPSNSPVPLSDLASGPSSPALIECPEPNCSKKYKHINGLRYHQSHQHQSHAHNNFAEDSDSNASTASTQLATPIDQQPSSSEPMAIDSICDMDDEASPTTMDELISVSKRTSGSNGNLAKIDDSSMYDPQDENARLSDKEYSDTQSLPLSSISGKSANKSGNNKGNNKGGVPESDSNKSFESLSKDACLSSNTASSIPRGAILTVPSFRSIGHSIHSSRDQETTVMKPTPILQPKGIPWQPHVHNPVVSHTQHSPSSTGITLNIPGEKHTVSTSKDKSSEVHSKKNKHKKKSKDKDKDGKSKSDVKGDRSSSKDTGARIGKFSHLSNSSGASEGRGSSADDLRPSAREELNFGDGNNAGVAGETRDDPLSPAYSDISDANDSGDGDLNVGVTVVKDGKGIGNNSDLKKDTPTVAPYFSPFYTPYMEPKLPDPTLVGLSPPDEVEKLKTGQQHSHVMQQNLPSSGPPPPSSSSSNPCDESGRSPKMDFPHHPKYLPHQQHYFHYPYSNYHFDQGHGQFNNVMSESSFNPPRGFISSDERDKEKEISGDALKNKLLERDIKQEPGLKDGGRPLNMLVDDKFCGEIKSEFGSSDYEQPPKSMSHHAFHQTCSKHSKDLSSKQRDDMNKGGDHFRPDKSKEDSDKELSKEKDKNNEGAKPTMETTGPPPPPTAGSYAYIPQPYLQPGSPFGIPFDPGHPLYRQVLVPGPYGGSPYMHPGSMPRYAQPSGNNLPLPEDLSRPPNVQQNTSSGAAKALDLLQHHAQYYQVHKIHELSERALKSPNPRSDVPPHGVIPSNTPTSPAAGGLSGSGGGGQGSRNIGSGVNSAGSPNMSSSSKVSDLSKESKLGGGLPPGGLMNESSHSPPTQHHHHTHVGTITHHHTHVGIGYGIGYPILDKAFPAPHSPHYGVLTTPPAPPVIPPFPSQKPT